MIKIKIFCSFAPSEKCKDVFEKINYCDKISFYGKDKKYYFTNDDDFNHAIIINTAMPKLIIPKENVIGLAFEPVYFLGLTREFIKYAKKHIGRYFIGDKNDLPEPFIEHFAYMWHSRPPKEALSINLSTSQESANSTSAHWATTIGTFNIEPNGSLIILRRIR
jgi:hypothetical protein